MFQGTKYPRPEIVSLINRHFGGVPEHHLASIRVLSLCPQHSGEARHVFDLGMTPDMVININNMTHLPNSYFDLAVDVMSSCLSIKFKEIIGEVHRVLVKGGRLFWMVPDKDGWHVDFEMYDSIQLFTTDLIRRTLNGKFKFYIGHSHILEPGEPISHMVKYWVIDAIKV